MDENIIAVRSKKNTDEMVKTGIVPYLKDIGSILIVILFVFLFCFRIAVVDGTSMNNTLIHNDYILLLNDLLAGDPEQGDIIVASTTYRDGSPIIKRVIATEGQKVDINFETGVVTVDGVVLDEPYISTPTTMFEGVYFPITVDEGCVFVMGDNRGVSKDSRDPEIGQIDCREIVGKAIFLMFPGVDPVTGEKDLSRIGALS